MAMSNINNTADLHKSLEKNLLTSRNSRAVEQAA